jgi:hypothetical protein
MWHPTRNGGSQPEHYTHASHVRVWLQCDGCSTCGQQHQWDARATALTRHGGEFVCGACESRGGVFCSCRSVATNGLLAAEWHEDKPPPDKVAIGNHELYKWRCSDAECGHVWEAAPDQRSLFNSGCPQCGLGWRCGKGTNVSLAEGRPDLVAEWDEKRNGFKTADVTCGSGKNVFWIRKLCGRSWRAKVVERALRSKGCSSCLKQTWRQSRKFGGISEPRISLEFCLASTIVEVFGISLLRPVVKWSYNWRSAPVCFDSAGRQGPSFVGAPQIFLITNYGFCGH